jgi:hypothetical protein
MRRPNGRTFCSQSRAAVFGWVPDSIQSLQFVRMPEGRPPPQEKHSPQFSRCDRQVLYETDEHTKNDPGYIHI